MDFNYGTELLQLCETYQMPIWQVMKKRETKFSQMSEEQVDEKMTVSLEIMKRFLKSGERAFKSLYKEYLHDSRQLCRHSLGISCSPTLIFLSHVLIQQIFYGTITIIRQVAVGCLLVFLRRDYDVHRGVEQIDKPLIHLIFQAVRTADFRKNKMLPVHILFVIFLDVGTGAANKNVAQHLVADFRRQLAKLAVYRLLSLDVFLSLYLLC